MTGQQKDWLKRFIDMGEASEYIVEYLLKVEIEDEGQSNEDYGAQTRALKTLKEKVKRRVLDAKHQAS